MPWNSKKFQDIPVNFWWEIRQKKKDKFRETQKWLTTAPHKHRADDWHRWFENSPSATLYKNQVYLNSIGLDRTTIETKIGGREEDCENRTARRARIISRYQKTIREGIHAQGAPDPLDRIRFKLRRYNISGLPGHVTKDLCCPRVCAAVWHMA